MALNTAKKAKKRGPKDNTTRIKVYFTFEDGKPLVARFDLPHKGMNYMHLNIEDYHHISQSFNHYQFALESYETDLLESLQQALQSFDYYGSSLVHAGPDIDHLYLQRVSLERATFGLCGVVWSNLVKMHYLETITEEPSLQQFFQSVQLTNECKSYLTECYDVLTKHYIPKEQDPSSWPISKLFDTAVHELWP